MAVQENTTCACDCVPCACLAMANSGAASSQGTVSSSASSQGSVLRGNGSRISMMQQSNPSTLGIDQERWNQICIKVDAKIDAAVRENKRKLFADEIGAAPRTCPPMVPPPKKRLLTLTCKSPYLQHAGRSMFSPPSIFAHMLAFPSKARTVSFQLRHPRPFSRLPLLLANSAWTVRSQRGQSKRLPRGQYQNHRTHQTLKQLWHALRGGGIQHGLTARCCQRQRPCSHRQRLHAVYRSPGFTRSTETPT